jgi:hypothetical protein
LSLTVALSRELPEPAATRPTELVLLLFSS